MTTPAGDATRTAPAVRFRMIDGLRGIAAMAVVFYHLRLAVDDAAAGAWMWPGLRWIVDRGFLGVDVFFVLSGFVIAYSTRTGPHTLGYLGRFALRRSIRLDPPYWVAIALEIALVGLTIRLFPQLASDLPSLASIGAHLLYLQNILGYGDIVPIFWTLCYEIQFYLFFVVLLIAWRRVPVRFLAIAVIAATFALSLWLRFSTAHVQGLALDRWFQFLLGVLAWWVISGRIALRTVVLAWSIVMAVSLAAGMPDQIVGVGTSVLIVAAGLRDRMGVWLTNAPVQFLGRISYSLYLIHLASGWRFVALCGQLLGPLSAPMAWLVLALGTGVSVFTAALMWRIIEAPTMALSKSVHARARSTRQARSSHAPAVVAAAPAE